MDVSATFAGHWSFYLILSSAYCHPQGKHSAMVYLHGMLLRVEVGSYEQTFPSWLFGRNSSVQVRL